MSRLIPFALLPASWGLKGQPHDEAKAFYELSGESLSRRLNDIRNADNKVAHEDEALKLDWHHDHITYAEYQKAGLAYQLARGEIDQLQHDIQTIKNDAAFSKHSPYERDVLIAQRRFPEAGVERSIAILEVDHMHEKISKQKFAKEKATLLEEPWVDTVESGFDPKEGVNGFHLTLDWNSYWVEYLRMNGYTGLSESDIVEKWFADVCRSREPINEFPHDGLIPFRGPFSSDAGTFVV